MRKYLFIFFMLFSVICFAQDSPKKHASWSISSAFQAEGGFVGSYWKPTFNIALDKEGYYCVVNLYDDDAYYSINEEELPHLYLKTDSGKVVDLALDSDEPIHKIYLKGYYIGRVWMPERYVTRFIYYIPDINTFLSENYIKYRIWLGEYYKDVEFKNGYDKKFNKRLYGAFDEVTLKYKKKEQSLNNPLENF